MSVHRDKVKWGLGKKLKKAVRVVAVGVLAVPIGPIAAVVIAGTGLAMAGKSAVSAKRDLDYIDYVNNLED